MICVLALLLYIAKPRLKIERRKLCCPSDVAYFSIAWHTECLSRMLSYFVVFYAAGRLAVVS